MQRPDQLFVFDLVSLGLIALRTVVVYIVVLAALRLAGKREIGQMTPFDLVTLLIISNAVQNAMIGPDVSLGGGLLATITLVVLSRVLSWLGLRIPLLQRGLTGQPSLLIHDGHVIEEHLRAEGVNYDEVLQALREHGVDDVGAVKDAVLEIDGTISVVPMTAASSRTRRRIRGRKPAG